MKCLTTQQQIAKPQLMYAHQINGDGYCMHYAASFELMTNNFINAQCLQNKQEEHSVLCCAFLQNFFLSLLYLQGVCLKTRSAMIIDDFCSKSCLCNAIQISDVPTWLQRMLAAGIQSKSFTHQDVSITFGQECMQLAGYPQILDVVTNLFAITLTLKLLMLFAGEQHTAMHNAHTWECAGPMSIDVVRLSISQHLTHIGNELLV